VFEGLGVVESLGFVGFFRILRVLVIVRYVLALCLLDIGFFIASMLLIYLHQCLLIANCSFDV